MSRANFYYDTEMTSHEIDDRTLSSVHKTLGDFKSSSS